MVSHRPNLDFIAQPGRETDEFSQRQTVAAVKIETGHGTGLHRSLSSYADAHEDICSWTH